MDAKISKSKVEELVFNLRCAQVGSELSWKQIFNLSFLKHATHKDVESVIVKLAKLQIGLLAMFAGSTAFAAPSSDSFQSGFIGQAGTVDGDITQKFQWLIALVAGFAGIIEVLLIIWWGVKLVSAGVLGNPQSRSDALTGAPYIMLGIFLSAFAPAFLVMIVKKMG